MSQWSDIKRVLIGRPLPSSQASSERLSKVKALAILSSDALSSVAYATEESLLTLMAAGTAALSANIPIALVIMALLVVVTISYRQTIFAYPSGGGAYTVASDNLGRLAGLTAAAALLIDYVLTVAVSVSSGVAAMTSAAPLLAPHTVGLGLLFIVLITMINLRGVRDSGSIFAVPTYLFIISILALLAIGAVKAWILPGGPEAALPQAVAASGEGLGLFLLLKAFASGCSAMTGVEAISNGVPVFEAPESKNAAHTMIAMSSLLGLMFIGITFLSKAYHLVPSESETILSQLAHQVIGDGWFYYVIQGATLLVLVLAANTSYADFPRLASILAKDGFMPRQFTFRGDRLSYSVGIVALAGFAAVTLVLFRGSTTALIPLYAIGVFVSFTLSQAGMVRHWWRLRGRGWHAKALVNGVGATATLLVAVIAGITKFISGSPLFTLFDYHVHAGAWIVLLLIPLHIFVFLGIHRHYQRVKRDAVAELPTVPTAIRHRLIIPVASLWATTMQSLAYAASIGGDLIAVHVSDDAATSARFRELWQEKTKEAPFLSKFRLVTLESPYRSLVQPLLKFIDDTTAKDPGYTVTVILAELVPSHWWEQVLHNHTALRLKAALLFSPSIVVANVPYHLRSRTRPRKKRPRL